MKRLLTASIVLLNGSAGMAAEAKLSGAEILSLLSDQTLAGAEAGSKIEQIFQKGGLTLYTDNGAQSQGEWKVEEDQYCSVWPPSTFWACYDVLRDGARVTFVSRGGKQTPMLLKSH
jgi:hypothetical protein